MRDNEAHSSGGRSSPVAPTAGLGEEIPGNQKHHRVRHVRRPRCVHSLSRRSQCQWFAYFEDLQEAEATTKNVNGFKHKEVLVRDTYVFPCFKREIEIS